MRLLSLTILACALAGCPKRGATDEPNRNPYRNVTPKKIQAKVEKIETDEAERNDKRLEQAK